MADLERFIHKGKPVTYTGVFVEFYNWRNRGQVYKIYEIVELKKICALTVENPRILDAHQIIKIFSILYNAYFVLKD